MTEGMQDALRTVLQVEDTEEIEIANRRILESAGYRVLSATTLAEAREFLAQEMPDLVLLDIMLPDGSGIELCEEIRRAGQTPILLLSALDEKQQIVSGLSAGADDYLTKPYDVGELRARIEALLRRAHPAFAPAAAQASPTITYGPLLLDTAAMRAMIGDSDLLLTPREFFILLALVRSEGEALTADALYERTSGNSTFGDTRAIRSHISRLRTKLRENSGTLRIDMVAGEGYRFVVEDEQKTKA